MTHQEVKALAGHRAVPPWIMKLVSDAIAIERQREREKFLRLSTKARDVDGNCDIVLAADIRGDKA